MEQSFNLPKDFSMEEAMRLAKSPAAQQLIALLQRQGGGELEKAVSSAQAGNMEDARQALSAVLQNPEAKRLLKGLGR